MDDGTTQTANLFGLDLIASDDGTATLTMLPDGLGSVRVEMQGGGGAVNSVTTYEPYGTLLMRTGPSGTVYGYTGEQMDGATGVNLSAGKILQSIHQPIPNQRPMDWEYPATLHSKRLQLYECEPC